MRKLRKVISVLLVFTIFSVFIASHAYAYQTTPDGGGGNASTNNTKEDSIYNYKDTPQGTLIPKEKTQQNSSSLFRKYGYDALQIDYVPVYNEQKKVVQDCPSDFSLSSVAKIVMGTCQAAVAKNLLGQTDVGQTIEKATDIFFYVHFINDYFWHIYLLIAFCFAKFVGWAFTLEIVTMVLKAYQQAMLSLKNTLWDPLMFLMWSVALGWMIYYWISGKKTQLWTTFLNSLIIIALSTTIFANLPKFLQTIADASTDVSMTILSGLVNQNHDEALQNADAKTHGDIAQNVMEDNMYGILIDLPYVLINFGSPATAQVANIDKVLGPKKGDESREDILKKAFDKADAKGKQGMLWLTGAKALERLAVTVVITWLAIAVAVCFCLIAGLTIIWQFIALGRGLLGVLYLIISLWPGYGMKEAAMWGWSMIQALFMKVFYSIVLAIYIIMVVALASHADDIGFIYVWLLAIGIFIGLMIALKELRGKLTNIPLGNGMFLKGTSDEAEQVLSKAGKAAVTVGALATGAGLAAAGHATAAKHAVNVARRGVGGAMKQGAYQGIESLAGKRSKVRDEKLEQKKEDKAFENRLEGMDAADQDWAREVRRDTGLDVTTAAGREDYEKLDPRGAEARKDQMKRLKGNELAQAMKADMPRDIPLPGTPAYAKLAAKYGEENVEKWRQAQAQAQLSVDAKKAEYDKNMPVNKAAQAKYKLTNSEPKLTTEAILKNFKYTQNEDQAAFIQARNKAQEEARRTADYTTKSFGKRVFAVDSKGETVAQAAGDEYRVTAQINHLRPNDPKLSKQFDQAVHQAIEDAMKKQGRTAKTLGSDGIKVSINVPNMNGGGGTTQVTAHLRGIEETEKFRNQYTDGDLALKISEIIKQQTGGKAVSDHQVKTMLSDLRAEFGKIKGSSGFSSGSTVIEGILGKAGLDLNQQIDMLGPMLGIDFRDLYTYKERMEKISKRLNDLERKKQPKQQKSPKTPGSSKKPKS